MKAWEKVQVAAMAGALLWVVWYDHVKCPACKAEERLEANRRGMERHRTRHGKAATR